MNEPTMRDRLLAVLRGEPVDKVPLAIYEGLGTTPERLCKRLSPAQIALQRWIACHRLTTPNCTRHVERIGGGARPMVRTYINTPRGTVYQDRLDEPEFAGSAVKSHFIKQVGDFEILLCYLCDTEVSADMAGLEQANAELGEWGLAHCVVPRSPYQQLLVEWVDAEELSWYYLENATLVLACLEEMVRVLHEVFDIVAGSPAPYVVFPDNLHAPVIGRTHFGRYCVPVYNELADRLYERGVPVLVRMDGDLRQLAYDIEDSYISGIEAMSPPPAHDMSIREALRQWPRLVVGAQFPTDLHLKPASVVYEKALEMVGESGGCSRLFLQIADTIPQGRWSISLPAICKAIDDYAASLSY